MKESASCLQDRVLKLRDILSIVPDKLYHHKAHDVAQLEQLVDFLD